MKRTLRLALILFLLCIALGNYQGARVQAQATIPPTNTPRPLPTLVPSPTDRETATIAPTRTPTVNAAATKSIPARLCPNCDRTRVRQTPGTAGNVIEVLDHTAELGLIGRTADNVWLMVIVKIDNQRGWIATRLIKTLNGEDFDTDTLETLPVAGVAVEASPTPTIVVAGVPIPGFLSGVTAHARQIFVAGQSQGNRADVFSKVGDSISVSGKFLYPFGSGQYDLGQYGYLGGVIGYYSRQKARDGNSFVNASLAAGDGWTTERLLAKGGGNRELCGNDTPLECEYKRVKPAVALIMIGTNDSGSGSPGAFGGNLAQIVQITIDNGVVPILSTIPPKMFNPDQLARVQAFNDVIRATARQFDVPLIDYYATMKDLPNMGISADLLHPSIPPDGAAGRLTPENLKYGFTMRNLTTLQALNVIWRLVLY